MLRGLYSAASAMDAASRNQEIVAENLAHAVTPGYRRQGSLFEINAMPPNDLASATQSSASIRNPRGYSNFVAGPLEQTNQPYDLAIVGDGFFVLNGPNGPVYTRNGSFVLNANGELQARGSGYALSGSGGPISIPPTASQVAISGDGAVMVNGAEIARLQLATFERLDSMRRVGPTLFEADDPQTPTAGSLRVEQGYREGSNVQPVQEMVSMMLGMRYYEAAEKALRSISDAISQNTRAQQ